MSCKEDISTLPIITGCPADDELVLFNNVEGGWSKYGNPTGYAWRVWGDLKNCFALSPIPPYDWQIGTSTSSLKPMKAGDISVTLDGTNGTRDLRGCNIQFARGGEIEYTTDVGDGSTFYSWNIDTGLFVLSTRAQLGELFRIVASR
jgi:hypothetical protein